MLSFPARLRRQYDPWSYAAGELRRQFAHPTRNLENPAEVLRAVHAHADRLAALDSDALRALAPALRARVQAGAPLLSLLPEAFALVREATFRAIGLRPYDVQLLAGLSLAKGELAEMATGEGKTLAAIPPAFLHALSGHGVHIATVNSYLAARDHEFTAPVFSFLGLSSALLPDRVPTPQKRAAYAADITYGVGAEFGFDYLRDQIALHALPDPPLGDSFRRALLGRPPPAADTAQRPLAYALVDEADSILIDEALSPLLISGAKAPSDETTALPFRLARDLASRLLPETDYIHEVARSAITLTPVGLRRIHGRPPDNSSRLPPVVASETIPWHLIVRPWQRYVENALHAAHVFRRDSQYIVKDEKVLLVDEFTGRAFPDRSWRDGLHQAVEAHETLPVTAENLPLASIARQRFHRLYRTLSGMTGTALEAAGELWAIYHLHVTQIPLHRPSRLEILPERVFLTSEAKLDAAASDIGVRHARRQPVLIGTRTVESSELIAERLLRLGLPSRLLNARQDSEEAEIISLAGQPGAITIATNMAGRGAHIPIPPEVLALGGLHVLSLERSESARIDRQLLGRSGRQGQPGSAQMFLSLQDYLLTQHAPDLAETLAELPVNPQDELLPPRAATAAAAIRRLQRRVEEALYRRRRAQMQSNDHEDETKQRL